MAGVVPHPGGHAGRMVAASSAVLPGKGWRQGGPMARSERRDRLVVRGGQAAAGWWPAGNVRFGLVSASRCLLALPASEKERLRWVLGTLRPKRIFGDHAGHGRRGIHRDRELDVAAELAG